MTVESFVGFDVAVCDVEAADSVVDVEGEEAIVDGEMENEEDVVDAVDVVLGN